VLQAVCSGCGLPQLRILRRPAAVYSRFSRSRIFCGAPQPFISGSPAAVFFAALLHLRILLRSRSRVFAA